MPSLRRGRVLVKNWHEFERKGMSAGAKVQKHGVPEIVRATIKIGAEDDVGPRRPLHDRAGARARASIAGHARSSRTGGRRRPRSCVEETRYVESDAKLMQRLLGREVGGKQNILVLNDEAHHAYRIRQEATETAEEDAECDSTRSAPRSSRTSRRSGSTGSTGSTSNRRINFCVDLSATPYYLARAGEDTNRIFPWVVSDFGLTDAIESGLVKIPQLAHSDPTRRGAGARTSTSGAGS